MQRIWHKGGLYYTCPYCESNLDPGERCDCLNKTAENRESQIEDNIRKALHARGYVVDDAATRRLA